MHRLHCGSPVFPYQALERRPAQETLTRCAGLATWTIRRQWTLYVLAWHCNWLTQHSGINTRSFVPQLQSIHPPRAFIGVLWNCFAYLNSNNIRHIFLEHGRLNSSGWYVDCEWLIGKDTKGSNHGILSRCTSRLWRLVDSQVGVTC
jgi:hypothetical protein